jgi:type IV pilus assembly protein PilV
MAQYENGVIQMRQGGFVLLEALVAVVILALGILGLVALQAQMLKATSEARYRAQASLYANQLVANMWLDQAGLGTKWAVTASGCSQTSNAVCTAWHTALKSSLPNGSAAVTFAGNQANIVISWQAPGESAHRFETEATINN